MADDKLNTGPEKAEGVSHPEQSGPETRPTEEHTAESPPRPAPGEVVVDFDKINELMAQKRAAAREAVEKAEASTADKGGKEASGRLRRKSRKRRSPAQAARLRLTRRPVRRLRPLFGTKCPEVRKLTRARKQAPAVRLRLNPLRR